MGRRAIFFFRPPKPATLVRRPLLFIFLGTQARSRVQAHRVSGHFCGQIEVRWAVAGADRTSALAKQLVDLRPDAILGVTTPVTDVLILETSTIPIVFVA